MSGPQLMLKLQSFTEVDAKEIPRLRKDPAALKKYLESKDYPRNGVGMFWHAIPYLLTGVPKQMEEPYRWFVDGGEIVGRNRVGDVRYLSPPEVSKLARALAEEPPDELGEGMFDPAKMDRHAIYPARWMRWSDNDHLGAMRELYSYLRDMLVRCRKQRLGVLIHLDEEQVDDEGDEPATAPTPKAEPPRPSLPGKPIFVGAEGRSYYQVNAAEHPKATAAFLRELEKRMDALKYSLLGDFAIANDPEDTIRAYLSGDRTIVAIQYFSAFAIGGRIHFCRLEGDALLLTSSALMTPLTKARLFVDFLQNAEHPALDAAILERRAKLAKKFGAPVVLAPKLTSAAELWEEQFTRRARGR